MLLGARLLMGNAEGGMMPISQSMIATAVRPEHRGLAMGVTQNYDSNVRGSFEAPVALVAFATAFGWRNAFLLAGLPGLVSALLIWWLVRESAPGVEAAPAVKQEKLTMREAFAERNVLICAVLGILLVSYLVVCWAF